MKIQNQERPLPQGEGRGEGINTPTMTWVPKTLVFVKDDDHCDRIVDAVREVFDEGNAFCKKITYKVGKKTTEESITNLPGANLVALQCAAKRDAPWTARNRAFRNISATKMTEFDRIATYG